MQKLKFKASRMILRFSGKFNNVIRTRLMHHIDQYLQTRKESHLRISFWLERIFFESGVKYYTVITNNLKEAAEKVNKLFILREITTDDPSFINVMNDYRGSLRILEFYKKELKSIKLMSLDQYKDKLLKNTKDKV